MAQALSDKILCSAIWVNDDKEYPHQPPNIKSGIVFCGHRHCSIFPQITLAFGEEWKELRRLSKYETGFLTERGLFVDRRTGAQIAFDAYQIEINKDELYSEDLY